VDEAFQRTNLGIRLYRKLEQRLKRNGVRMIMADTDAENEPAISFFKSIGFTDSSQHIWLVKTIRRPNENSSKTT
jgi:ribosomal protein S18 acetylase RimI-like enzyme